MITNWTLDLILREAFNVKYYQISGGPDWIRSDRFDITAKAAGEPARDQMMRMLQTLLAERFQLKVRRETKEGTVYSLTVSKSGSKLKEAKGDHPPAIRTYRQGSPEKPAISYSQVGQNATIPMLIETLSNIVTSPVRDQTNLKGNFDFKLEYAADDTQPDAGPSIFTAIQEQFGLRLEKERGPVETPVIDHAGKPSGLADRRS